MLLKKVKIPSIRDRKLTERYFASMKTYKALNEKTFYALMALISLPIIVSFLSRYKDPSSNDFEAFYLCASRWLQGDPIYISSDAFPFKYPPITIIFFSPLALFSIDHARWILGLINLAACLSIPWALYYVFHNEFIPKNPKQRRLFLLTSFAGLIASLRFIDNEFHSKNINQLTYALIVWSLVLLKNPKNIFREFFGIFLFMFGGIFKLTPLLGLTPQTLNFKNKRYWLLFAGALFAAPIPNPLLWKSWLEQIKNTTGFFPFSDRSIYFQGFFAMGSHFLGLPSRSKLSLLLALPFVGHLLIRTFKVLQFKKHPNSILTLSLVWILLSLLINPLPWQHIYGFFWIILPALFYCDLKSQYTKRIWALCLFLALSPRSIIGTNAAYWLEVNQSIALLALLTIMLASKIILATNDE
jgi:uncharacterized membrane protein